MGNFIPRFLPTQKVCRVWVVWKAALAWISPFLSFIGKVPKARWDVDILKAEYAWFGGLFSSSDAR
jgi:hypothetical protein